MSLELQVLNQDYLIDYKSQLKVDVESKFFELKNQTKSQKDFNLSIANSAVHSSNIEGNTVSFEPI